MKLYGVYGVNNLNNICVFSMLCMLYAVCHASSVSEIDQRVVVYSAEEFKLIVRKVLTERCSLEQDLY